MNSFNINMKSSFEFNKSSILNVHYNFVNSLISNDPGSLNKDQVARIDDLLEFKTLNISLVKKFCNID